MNDVFGIILRFALIFGIIGLFRLLVLRERLKEKPPGTVSPIRLPRFYFPVGIICAAFFCFIIIGCLFFGPPFTHLHNWKLAIVFVPFMLLGLIPALGYMNWEIRIDGRRLYYRTFLRTRFVFQIDEVKHIRFTYNYIIIKVRGKTCSKTFWIDQHADVGFQIEKFLEMNKDYQNRYKTSKFIKWL